MKTIINIPDGSFSLFILSLDRNYRLRNFSFPKIDRSNQVELLTQEEVLNVCGVLYKNYTNWITPPNPKHNRNNRFTYGQPYYDDCSVYDLETINDPLGAYYFSKYVIVGKLKNN